LERTQTELESTPAFVPYASSSSGAAQVRVGVAGGFANPFDVRVNAGHELLGSALMTSRGIAHRTCELGVSSRHRHIGPPEPLRCRFPLLPIFESFALREVGLFEVFSAPYMFRRRLFRM
jgi:hypothetical protein